MSSIIVTRRGQSTAPIIWTHITAWTAASMQVHVQVPGGRGLGVTFTKGVDNAVATLTGRVRKTPDGTTQYEALSGARLNVHDGIGLRECIAGTPVQQGDGKAWIYFTLTVTEVRR